MVVRGLECVAQHHFVSNMFIRAKTEEEVRDFKPDFTIINACKVTNPDWKAQKLHSDVFIAVNVEKVCACACVCLCVCVVCACACVWCVWCVNVEKVCACVPVRVLV